MVIRTGNIITNWLTISSRSEQVLAMGKFLPEGARIYAVHGQSGVEAKLDRGFIHVIEFWTISHDADISTLFALPGQQPLVFRQPPCSSPEWTKCLTNYEYIWTNDPQPILRQEILRIASPAATWEKVTLWRVNRKSIPYTDTQPDSGLL
jgi:hypothetical protein